MASNKQNVQDRTSCTADLKNFHFVIIILYMPEREFDDKEKSASDPELDIFLTKVVHEFKNMTNLMDIEEAAIALIAKMTNEERNMVVEISKKHFILSTCHLHDEDIVNDESYSENVKEGEPTEGLLLDYKLTTKNIGEFLAIEGRHSLRAHIDNLLSVDESEELSGIEIDRQLDYYRFRGSTAG